MLKDKYKKRFIELDDQFQKLPFRPNHQGNGTNLAKGDWMKWATSAQNLILAVFSEDSPHYSNLVSAISRCFAGYDYEVNAIYGVFESAKEDFEGGYVFDIDLRISGEVFGDFVGMAKHALSEDHKDVAAVLACAALEDTLKKFAEVNGLTFEDTSMTGVVNALKSKGLVSGAQKTLLNTMPRIRNLAMHAQWEKISAPDVSSVIGFVEQFLLSNFSSD